ncbi:ABC transporter substrate-binding protein [Mahella australiensis]|uniref:Extracellular solute-binding protein family 1 n=1 Tax=Mahella australiensis (strain DSM 15567 / CIP 107919 / 50-1 BON) TaxID=697281 RepID=F4A264_MAHA5|nr:extracellular solute-binding protein [Mahella australiensis]AEE97203.1 extracellular solute-binding protein family 1 [Mahella australiensis 50-1 BON]
MTKKITLALAIFVLIASLLTGCKSANEPQQSNQAGDQTNDQTGGSKKLSGEIVMWTYFDQVKWQAESFMSKNPNIKVNVQVFPGDQYENKIRMVLQSGQNAPDVFDLEEAYVGKFIDNPALADLSAMGADKLLEDYAPYLVALGKDKSGKIKAVTDNGSPGGFWYNRKSAKEYLGTDDPDKLSEMFSSWDSIIKLSQDVVQKSGSKVHLLAHFSDAIKIEALSKKPFIEDGKLTIDPAWNDVLDVMREIRSKNLDAKLDPWSPAWGAAINDGSVIAWAMPSWSGFFIDNKDGKANGTVGIAKAPKPYFEGATMRAIYDKSPNKDLAFEFIKYFTTDEYQVENLKKTGNMPAKLSVYKNNMETYKDPLFGDQNILKTYYDIISQVPAHPADRYYRDSINLFGSAASEGITKGQTNEQIFDAFRGKIKNAYPEIELDK